MQEPRQVQLVSIGAGNMGGAILRGAIASGVIEPKRIVVVDRNSEKRERFSDLGCRVCSEIAEVGAVGCEAEPEERGGRGEGGGRGKGGGGGGGGDQPTGRVLMLAFKPQGLDGSSAQIRRFFRVDDLVVSLLAGVTVDRLARTLSVAADRIIRVMPNTPVGIGEGVSLIVPGAGVRDDDVLCVERIFGSIGITERVPEELMDAATAVSGSGPAYLFYLAEAMSRAGAQMGLDPEQSDRITRQTLLGAAKLLAGSDEHAEQLRARVSSKGGMTAVATDTFDARGVKRAIADGMDAARRRGEELARS